MRERLARTMSIAYAVSCQTCSKETSMAKDKKAKPDKKAGKKGK